MALLPRQIVFKGHSKVSVNDLLSYWSEDPNTRVIMLYLESIGNPRKFTRISRRLSRRSARPRPAPAP